MQSLAIFGVSHAEMKDLNTAVYFWSFRMVHIQRFLTAPASSGCGLRFWRECGDLKDTLF